MSPRVSRQETKASVVQGSKTIFDVRVLRLRGPWNLLPKFQKATKPRCVTVSVVKVRPKVAMDPKILTDNRPSTEERCGLQRGVGQIERLCVL